MKTDTIAAIATALSNSGIGIIRISGDEAVSICDAVFACSDLLTQFGGHPMAVGFGIEKQNIDAFITAINDYAKTVFMPQPILELDCKLNPAQLSLSLVDQLVLDLRLIWCGIR